MTGKSWNRTCFPRKIIILLKTKTNIMALQQYAGKPEPDYDCTQAELYGGLQIVWNSQAQHETEFEAENTQYTAGLSVTKKAAITAAENMPDGQARGEVSETKRIEMSVKLVTILSKWRSLDGYIKKAFPGAFYKPKIEAAGKPYYSKAANENWEVVKSLLTSAKNFLTSNEAALLADGGMPTNFITGFDTVKGQFETLFEEFKEAQQESEEQRDAKINANNAIYADGRSMMEDGKRIFSQNHAVRERFVWERVLELLTPNSGDSTQVFEDDIAVGGVAVIDLDEMNLTPDSTVIVKVEDNILQFSSGPDDSTMTGPTIWTAAIMTQTKDIDEFGTLIGADETNHFVKIACAGPSAAHYKITFTNLG
jgi:hypothetical protein